VTILVRLMKVRMPRKLKVPILVLGWATSIAAVTLFTIFQGQLLPKNIITGGGQYAEVISPNPVWLWIFYSGSFAICLLAAMTIEDLAETLLSFFASFVGAAMITYLVLALPDILGIFPYPGALEQAAVGFTFGAFFPFPFFVNFVGTMAGLVLADRLL
jgi:hypothetical protein